MRWSNFAWAIAWGFVPCLASATLTITPSGVNNPVLAGQKIYYAAQKYVAGSLVSPAAPAPTTPPTNCPTAIDAGFQIFNVAQNRYADFIAGVTTHALKLRVASSPAVSAATGKILVAMARVTNGATPHYVPIASVNGTTCGAGATCYSAGQVNAGGSSTSVGHFYAVPYASGGTVLGFYPADVCSEAYLKYSNNLIAGCELNSGDPRPLGLDRPESVPQASGTPITLEIVIHEIDAVGTVAPAAAPLASLSSLLHFQVKPPDLLGCSVYGNSGLYFPGDGRLFVDTGAFTMATCGESTVTSGFAPANALIAVATDIAVNPDVSTGFRVNNTVVSESGVGGFAAFSGFTNATTTGDNKYNVSFVLRDAAGLIAPPPGVTAIGTNLVDWTYNSGSTANNCNIPGAQASAINGVVAQNRCFIATSAFGRDPDSAPVALLREFRDEWLEATAAGRRLVRVYYAASPQIAGWMDEVPVLRIVALKFLAPVESIAWLWVTLPGLAWLLLGAGCGILIVVTSLRVRALMLLFFLLVLGGQGDAVLAASFIDEVKAGLDQEAPSQGYSDRERAKLGETAESQESFIDSVRPVLEEAPDSTGYSDKVRPEIPPGQSVADRPSVTETSLAEQKPLEPRYKGDIHFAGGLRYGALVSRSLTGGNGNFGAIYGAAYVPEASLFGEWQPFHSEWLGNFGLIGSLGIAVFRGNGQYGVTGLSNPLGGSFSDVSRTKLYLNLIPATLGIVYRFNLLRILRPFASASGVAYGIIETRDDGIDSKRTFGLGTQLAGGVSILMDWFEPGSAWDAYASAGIRHSYVTVEYSYLMPLYGDLLYVSNGVQAGFTFEF